MFFCATIKRCVFGGVVSEAHVFRRRSRRNLPGKGCRVAADLFDNRICQTNPRRRHFLFNYLPLSWETSCPPVTRGGADRLLRLSHFVSSGGKRMMFRDRLINRADGPLKTVTHFPIP